MSEQRQPTEAISYLDACLAQVEDPALRDQLCAQYKDWCGTYGSDAADAFLATDIASIEQPAYSHLELIDLNN